MDLNLIEFKNTGDGKKIYDRINALRNALSSTVLFGNSLDNIVCVNYLSNGPNGTYTIAIADEGMIDRIRSYCTYRGCIAITASTDKWLDAINLAVSNLYKSFNNVDIPEQPYLDKLCILENRIEIMQHNSGEDKYTCEILVLPCSIDMHEILDEVISIAREEEVT